MDSIEQAAYLLGGGEKKKNATHSANVTQVTGIASVSSEDGAVSIDLDGVTISDDQSVEVETTVDVREGDQVEVSVIGSDGSAKRMVVTGVVGGGDRTAAAIAGNTEKVLRVEKDLDSITLTDDVTGEITVNGSSIELNSIPAEAIDDAFTSEVEANAEDIENLKTGMSEVRNSIKIDNGDASQGIDPSITLMVKDADSDDTLNGVRIEPSEMVFIVDNAERAKVTPQGLESDSVIVNDITLDPFVWVVRESGHLSLKRRR